MAESCNQHEFSDDDDQSVVILETINTKEAGSDQSSDVHIDSDDDDDTSIDKICIIAEINEMKQEMQELHKCLKRYREEGKEDLEKVVSMINNEPQGMEHNGGNSKNDQSTKKTKLADHKN
jgi:hypothetical protein